MFELNEPEMMKTEEIILPPSKPELEDATETEGASEKRVKKVIYIFPHSWTNTFGRPISDIAHINMLEQKHYCGDWDVLRPAVEMEWCNVLTTEELGLLMQEAEKIMEDWLENE